MYYMIINRQDNQYYAAKGYEEEDLKRAFDETPAMIQWLQKKVGVPCM